MNEPRLRDSRPPDRLWWRQVKAHGYAVLVIGTFFGAIPWGLTSAFELVPVPLPWPMHGSFRTVLGAILGVAGGTLSYSCMIIFVVRGQGTAFPTDPPRSFVAVGPYRWSRNPMYLGNLTLGFGIGLLLASAGYLFYMIILGVAAHFYVLHSEEPRLRQRFGGAYVDYCATTPRWIPKQPVSSSRDNSMVRRASPSTGGVP